MEYRVSHLIWCDACCGENWDTVSTWIWDGKAAARSGRLRVPTWCRSCDAELPIGASVEAVTLFHDRPAHREWEDEYLGVETDGDANGLSGWEDV